jgi:catechol 2,3-dioxygenase-like lactoylglutathione lyase family enzyme
MAVQMYAVSLDCSDAQELATFWSAVLGRPVDDGATGDFAAIGLEDAGGHATQWMFHKVPEGKIAKNRAHVDLIAVDGLEAEVDRLIGLGAKRIADVEEGGFRWTTLADPAGNELDLVAP